jgi:hypothetical protein
MQALYRTMSRVHRPERLCARDVSSKNHTRPPVRSRAKAERPPQSAFTPPLGSCLVTLSVTLRTGP